MSEQMTAEQAWAEVDAAIADAGVKVRAADEATERILRAREIAIAIGPRPVKTAHGFQPCARGYCDGSGRTATKDGNFQLCICLVPS